MRDFLKIFFILCCLVAAFVFGRSYGEKTITESKEYIKMRSDAANTEKAESELSGLKTKFQELIDSSDLKKADEVLSKIMTVFLADLSLHLSEEKEKDLSAGKALCAAQPPQQLQTVNKKIEIQKPTPQESEAFKKENKFAKGAAKYKSLEWILTNSNSDFELKRNLKLLELKDLDTFLKNAPQTSLKDAEKFLGSYRGSVSDVTGKNYAMLVIELRPIKNAKNENEVKGKIEFYRNNKLESSGNFTDDHLGYGPAGFLGTILTLGARQLQIYSVDSSQKIAGYIYERLPNGTTKTEGSFVLNRVDKF